MAINRSVKKNQTVLYQGEVPSSTFIIKSGLIRALNINSAGEERTVALFSTGDYFPVGTAYEKVPVALFYYETMQDSELELLSPNEFNEYQKNNKDQIEHLANLFISSLLHINALGQTSARNKVACVLQYLSLRFGTELTGHSFKKISVQLTQHDIAKLCGLTRETTTVELNKLRSDNIIDVKKKFYTVHTKSLTKILENPEISNLEI